MEMQMLGLKGVFPLFLCAICAGAISRVQISPGYNSSRQVSGFRLGCYGKKQGQSNSLLTMCFSAREY